MLRSTAAALFFLSSTILLATACGPDRFTDSGCEVDGDCRGERVCVQGRCIEEGRAPDAGSDTDDSDDTGSEDADMLDIGTEEDSTDVELDPFIGEWELEGPITVVNEGGEVLQQTDPQPLPTVIESGEDSDLFVGIEALEVCSLTANVTGTGEFEIQPRDCESSPVDQIQGDATVLEGQGRLTEEGTTLTLDFRIRVDSTDFGAILLEFSLVGPRLTP